MDIVHFFSRLAERYDDGKICDFCWSYGAPLTESSMNKQELNQDKACCINIFLTDPEYLDGVRYSGTTQLLNYEDLTINFVLWVGKQVEDIGLNTYNEIPGHSIEEGLWETVYNPIRECFNRQAINDLLCEMKYNFDITRWQMRTFKFKDDKNLTGWKIQGSFRTRTD